MADTFQIQLERLTASVRAGLPVGVRVENQSGRPLYERAG
jgi:hypothetical protein